MACKHCTDPAGVACFPTYGLAPHAHTNVAHVFDLSPVDGFSPDPEDPTQGTWWCVHCGDGKPDEELKVADRIYFGNGPLEFIGIVKATAPDSVTVTGIETGCLATNLASVEIIKSPSLRIMFGTEWEQRIAEEPAFANLMTKDRFQALQAELEGLELALAKGEETGDTDFRIQVIKQLMSQAPWQMCPDDGCIPKAA